MQPSGIASGNRGTNYWPIVRQFGDADQFSAGIGITYSFGFGRF